MVSVLLGPEGFGVMSALQASINLIQGAVGLGIENSAVRDIAKARSSETNDALAVTVKTQRTLVWFTGLAGMVLTALFAPQISQITFDSTSYTWELRLLSISVFLNIIKSGQYALLQGLRRIKAIAMLSILGALVAALISVPIFYWLRMDGVALYLIVLSITQLLISWLYAREVKLVNVRLSFKQLSSESKGMIRLGVAFMGGSFVTLASTYLIKILIIDRLGIEAVGIYQAAFVISGLFINSLLTAMGKDFYPRLTSVAFDKEKETQLINEQIELSVVLAAPGLLLTIALAPYIIPALYTGEFLQAVEVLRWITLGFFLRLFSWPLGYCFIARSKTRLFFIIQVVTNSLLLALSFILITYFGLEGIGMSYAFLYVFHVIFMSSLVIYYTGFKWSLANLKSMFFYSILFGLSTWLLMKYEGVSSVFAVCVLCFWFLYRALRRVSNIMDLKSFRDFREYFFQVIKKTNR